MHNHWKEIEKAVAQNAPFAICRFPNEEGFHFFLTTTLGLLISEKGDEWVVQPFDFDVKSQDETTKEDYIAGINRAIQLLKENQLEKVVISRIKTVKTASDLNLEDLSETLNRKFPSAFVFIYSIVPHEIWFGATPELLLEKEGNSYRTVALAGTRLAQYNQEKWGNKEIREQAVVTNFIVNTIKTDMEAKVEVQPTATVRAAHLEHICTPIEFFSLLPLENWIKKLHPTPAVCGIPRERSKEVIAEIENHSRKTYAGVIGVKSDQNAKLFVQLRCAQWTKLEERINFFVGGGIMEDSIPENEWIETENKANVMLAVVSELV